MPPPAAKRAWTKWWPSRAALTVLNPLAARPPSGEALKRIGRDVTEKLDYPAGTFSWNGMFRGRNLSCHHLVALRHLAQSRNADVRPGSESRLAVFTRPKELQHYKL